VIKAVKLARHVGSGTRGYCPPEEFEKESGQRSAETNFAASALTFVRDRK